MKYFYKYKKQKNSKYTAHVDHPLYSSCSLYEKDGKGLAIVQQRFNPSMKVFFWGYVDPGLIDDIFSHEKFDKYFAEKGGECKDGLYPTVTVRQAMWALKMKPLEKTYWESQLSHLL